MTQHQKGGPAPPDSSVSPRSSPDNRRERRFNTASILETQAMHDPNRTAIMYPSTKDCSALDRSKGGGELSALSYGELDERVRRRAVALQKLGIQRGDRVALCARNCPAFVEAFFAILRCGAVAVPIAQFESAEQIEFRIKHAKCRLILYDGSDQAGLRSDLATIAERTAAEQCTFEDLREPNLLGEEDPDSSHSQWASRPLIEVAEEDPAMILYTSGTTADAKGAVIHHGNLMRHTRALQTTVQLSPEDRVLGVLPLTHSFGMRMTLLLPFYVGSAVFLMRRFRAAESLKQIDSAVLTWIPAVPTMFAAWSEINARHATSVRWCLSAGAPLAKDVRLRAEARLGAPIREGYGLTEASFSAIDAPPKPATPGSVGRPVHGVEIRILENHDSETEPPRFAPSGTVGEVLIRGQNQMHCFLDDPSATANALLLGFQRTGDLGTQGEDGQLWILSRKKDLIIRGGYNIVPAEIETALSSHPAISEVAVVGIDDPYYGQEPVAVVRVAEDAKFEAELLRAHLEPRIARTKIPHLFAQVAHMPMGSSRKVLKRVLREQLRSGALPIIRWPAVDRVQSATD
ncbi:MAG: AMP-binding protein [Myxococcota bacterium]